VPIAELFTLQRKVDALPFAEWKRSPRYALFSAGGFAADQTLAAKDQGVLLVEAEGLLA
jgi:hypothetical protein